MNSKTHTHSAVEPLKMSRASENALREAMTMQKSGNLEAAFDLYQNALQLLFQDHKSETDPAKKEVIQSIIIVYMESAEDLKSKIAVRKQQAEQIQRQPSPGTVIPQPPPPSPKPLSVPSTAPSTPSSASARPDFFDYSRMPPTAPSPAPTKGAAGSNSAAKPAASTTKTAAHRVPAAAARAIHGAKGTSNKASAGRGATTGAAGAGTGGDSRRVPSRRHARSHGRGRAARRTCGGRARFPPRPSEHPRRRHLQGAAGRVLGRLQQSHPVRQARPDARRLEARLRT